MCRLNEIDITVIIVNWNTARLLEGCLRSVTEETKTARLEIIVVDNNSSDDSCSVVKEKFGEVNLIENSVNAGFAAANNQAIKKALGRYVLLLNSDTVIIDNGLDKMLRYADGREDVDAFGCRVLNADRSLQPTCFMYPSVLNLFLAAGYLYKIWPRSRFFGREKMGWFDRDKEMEVEVVTGCFMLIRREAIGRVGLLDESFFMYAEETDWCLRCKRSGGKLIFYPGAEIIHYGGQSTEKAADDMSLQLRGSVLGFIKKHHCRLYYYTSLVLMAIFFGLRGVFWFVNSVLGREQRVKSVALSRLYFRGLFLISMRGASGLCRKPRHKEREEFDSVLCFGGEDWWYHNHGHIDMQLMRRFSEKRTVLYVNSLVMQKTQFGQKRQLMSKIMRKTRSIFSGLKKTEFGFWAFSPFALPVHHNKVLGGMNRAVLRFQLWIVRKRLGMRDSLVWVACPVAMGAALKMKRDGLIYQRTDRFEEYPNVDRDFIISCDRDLKRAADLTIFVSRSLYNEESDKCRRALYLDHGVDVDIFSKAHHNPEIPAELAEIRKPIAGFYGGFATHTTDVELLHEVVKLLPGISFVFVGEPNDGCLELAKQENVTFLGKQPYMRIPHYGKCFDVALMCWKQNEWIKGCNPIKLKEYLALGKPIVSTPFPQLSEYGSLVYVACSAGEFAEAINLALKDNSPEQAAVRKMRVKNDSWDSKASRVIEVLKGV